MTTKKVIHVVDDKEIFEAKLNEVDGFATQTSLVVDSKGSVHYFAVVFSR